MTRYRRPMIRCDYIASGYCDEETTDYFGEFASHVNGIRVTSTERSPGWTTTPEGDYCPKHAPRMKEVPDEQA